jgi:hypothetical protein
MSRDSNHAYIRKIEELLKAVFSMRSASMATSLCNKATARRGVLCTVHPGAMSGGSKPRHRKYKGLKLGGGQAYDRSSD